MPLARLALAVVILAGSTAVVSAQELSAEEESAVRVRCMAFAADPAGEAACAAAERQAAGALAPAPLNRLRRGELAELRIACAASKPSGAAAWRRCATETAAAMLAARTEQTAASPEQILAAQTMLSALGYAPGPADGFIGPRTREALARFAADRALPEPSDVTPELLAALQAATAEGAPPATAPVAAAPPAPAVDAVVPVAPEPAPIDEPLPTVSVEPAPAPSEPVEPAAIVPERPVAPVDTAASPPAEVPPTAAAEADPPAAAALPAADILARVAPSVFVVVAFETLDEVRAGKPRAIGSAVAIGPETVLTNCEVVDGSEMITLGADGDMLGMADVVRREPDRDRCVLRVNATAALPPVRATRGFAELVVGEPVFAVGTPGGLERTLSQGVITALSPGGSPRDRIAFSAPLLPGSSGGGLFDGQGRLIGITTFASEDQPINVAVAIDRTGPPSADPGTTPDVSN